MSRKKIVQTFALSALLCLVFGSNFSCIKPLKNKMNIEQKEQLSSSAVWQEFVKQYGDWKADWNKATGTPHRAIGPAIQIRGYTHITQKNIQDAAMSFLKEYKEILGIELEKLYFIRANEINNRWYVSYQQRENGLQVLNSEVELRIFSNGKVMSFGSDFYPAINMETSPVITIEIAKQKIQSSFIKAKINSIENNDEFFIYPRPNNEIIEYFLVYKFQVKTTKPLGNWGVYIDAQNGKIRYKQNRIRY